jgi:hypothetical protein
MWPPVPTRPQPLAAILATQTAVPARAQLTRQERRMVDRLTTPAAVQAWLNALPYNVEAGGETLRTFRGVVAHGTAHCLEAALFAAVTLEQHGYPPLLLSFESIDRLDHVIFIYRGRRGWGSIARSRSPSATSTHLSISAAGCAPTGWSTWRRWALMTGGSRPGACGPWNSCSSTGRTTASARRTRATAS